MRDFKVAPKTESPYECFECGTIVQSVDNPVSCPDCGGEIRNRQTPIE